MSEASSPSPAVGSPAPSSGAPDPARGAELALVRPATAAGSSAGTAGLSRSQKAAVIIGVLGTEAAGPILARLDEASLKAFTRAMASIGRIDAPTVRAVIAEFLAGLEEGDEVVRGGLARARNLLEAHVAESILSRLVEEAEPATPEAVWRRLARLPEERLAAFLAREHPQTVAVVLSRLPAERAAVLIDGLAPELAREVVLGLARLDALDPALLEALSEAIGRDLLAAAGAEAEAAPARRVGAIMDYLGAASRRAILESIEQGDPAFARAVRRAMFTVEDIPTRLPARAVPAVVRSLNQESLIRALLGLRESVPEVEEFLLANISSRMAEQLREEMKEARRPSRKEGERAQAALIRTIRELVAAGEIELLQEEDEEADTQA